MLLAQCQREIELLCLRNGEQMTTESDDQPALDGPKEPVNALPKKPKRPTLLQTQWDELANVWRRWIGKQTEEKVLPEEILRYLSILVKQFELRHGVSARPLDQILIQISAPLSQPAALAPVHANHLTVDVPAAEVRQAAIYASAMPNAQQQAVDVPAAEVRQSDRRERLDAQLLSNLAEVLRSELKPMVEQQREMGKRLLAIQSATDSVVQSAQTINHGQADQRQQVDRLIARMNNTNQRIDQVATEHEESTSRLKCAMSDVLISTRSTTLGIADVQAKLDHRVDLSDMKQVLKVRQEVERVVKGELIRNISLAITPAMEELQAALAAQDSVAIKQAMATLQKRCEKVELITDSSRLF